MGRMVELPTTTTATERWLTPRWVLDALGDFDLDPAGAPGWHTATEVWTPEEGIDGLMSAWHGRVWLNPPYGRMAEQWLDRLAKHNCGTALIFARTDTQSFHDHVWSKASALLFLRGRLTFLRPDGSSPDSGAGAASCLVAYGLEDASILQGCGLSGAFVPLMSGDVWNEGYEAAERDAERVRNCSGSSGCDCNVPTSNPYNEETA